MQDSFCCCEIEYNFVGFDTPTEKAYQINNGLDDTLQDMWCIQRAVSNWRHHWRRIQQQRRKIFWLLPIIIGLAVSVWLNTQYHGIDDTPTTEEEYQINNWIETASETDSIQCRCQLFVWLAVCGWTLNLNIVGLMILQQQQQQQQKCIKLIIGWYSTQEEKHSTGGIELETTSKKTDSTPLPILVGLAGSMWLNT